MNLELKKALGPLLCAVSAWVDGGFILHLLHRHDIRVGIASGMYIRSHWCVPVALRLELLCVLHLCYWRWSTKVLLQEMEQRIDEYAAAQPLARGSIWRVVWAIMEAKMEEMQVASWSTTKISKLMPRSEIKQARRLSDNDFSAHHAYMNPSSRRSGAKEFNLLVESISDGSLWRACQQIATQLQTEVSYTAVSDAMRNHDVALWKSGGYGCVRCAGVQAADWCC